MRKQAFAHVLHLQQVHDALTHQVLNGGFSFEGERIPLVNPRRGIFKPQKMQFLLSIKTTFPGPGRKIWYDDQRNSLRQILAADHSVEYDFMGDDPNAAENRWLREAFENDIPIPVIYFVGVAPGRYQAMVPAFISEWNPGSLKVNVSFGVADSRAQSQRTADSFGQIATLPSSTVERRYALRAVQQRLHQSSFREAVIRAYRGRCAISRIPEPMLLDAAHIIPDTHEYLGQPVVPNGLPLSKIHHAAFDAHLIGIDADYHLHVSDRLLEREDGPMLESLKGLKGQTIHLPNRRADRPDRDRLALRFEGFQAAS